MNRKLMKKMSYALLLVTPIALLQADDTMKPALNTSENLPVVEAVWVEQEGQFTYSSFDTYYSCTGLETNVEKLLTELGAKDVKARAFGCGSNGIDNLIPVKVKFKTLSTDSNLSGDFVKANYQQVEFNEIYRKRNFRKGDLNCDLVRGVAKSLIDKFEHEVIRKQGVCSSGHSSLNNDVKWKVKVLMPSS